MVSRREQDGKPASCSCALLFPYFSRNDGGGEWKTFAVHIEMLQEGMKPALGKCTNVMFVCLQQFNACTKCYLRFQSEQWQQRGHMAGKHSQRLVTTCTALPQAGEGDSSTAVSPLEMWRWFFFLAFLLWC